MVVDSCWFSCSAYAPACNGQSLRRDATVRTSIHTIIILVSTYCVHRYISSLQCHIIIQYTNSEIRFIILNYCVRTSINNNYYTKEDDGRQTCRLPCDIFAINLLLSYIQCVQNIHSILINIMNIVCRISVKSFVCWIIKSVSFFFHTTNTNVFYHTFSQISNID